MTNETMVISKHRCCRKCGLDVFSDIYECQERIEISFRGGYGSVFGDDNVIRGTFCQQCIKDLLGPWLEIISDDCNHNVPVFTPIGIYQPYEIMLPDSPDGRSIFTPPDEDDHSNQPKNIVE